MRLTPEREALIGELARAFARSGVSVALMRGPNLGPTDEGDEAALLVHGADAAVARRVLDGTDWRFELGHRGLWRVFPSATYLYDDDLAVQLSWGVPAAPFPFRRLRRLERAIWASANPGPFGCLEPGTEQLLVFLCAHAARLGLGQGSRHSPWSRDIALCAESVRDWDRVVDLARGTGTEQALRRGLARAGTRSIHPGLVGPGSDGPHPAWMIADVLQRRTRPRRLRAYLSASPRFGMQRARVRFAGIELDVGRGVFQPRYLAEGLVHGALQALKGDRGDVVADVGTGCGAVAMAIARAQPGLEIHAIDRSRVALAWARWNRLRLRAHGVHFHTGSLLDPLPDRLAGRVRVLTANLPYVPPGSVGERYLGVRSAVAGTDEDGLGLQRELIRQARRFLAPGGRLFMEMTLAQWGSMTTELRALGYVPGEVLHTMGSEVVVSASRPPA